MEFTVSTSRLKARALVVTCALACAAPISAADDFTPGVTDFPSRLAATDEFVPGVTDFPSYVADSPVAEPFVPGVSDVPNAFASTRSTPAKLPTPRAPASIAPAVDRFDWRDAGVGAAIAVGALVLAAGAALLARSRALLARSRAQSAH